MPVKKKNSDRGDESSNGLSRREFVAFSVAAGLGAPDRSTSGADWSVIETKVKLKTSDGICDAAFFYPAKDSHPGVLIWPDSGSLRPAFRELGRRIASQGYSVLVPNHLYRMARSPVFPESFDPIKNREDKEFYSRVTAPFFAPGAVERDAVAYITYLSTQPQVSKKRKMGTHGYCLSGAYVIKTAALFPDRVAAGASFHGGFLVTDKPDSPHLLAPKIKARLYFAIASDDDKREPEVKIKLKETFAAAKVRAEIEVYPNALHGWCVPDSKNVNKEDVDRAWARLLALYQAEL
jgi:carboxymethylenebutenolidase